MSNVLATWIYLDEKGEETNFPQTSLLSSSKEHQAIYWRCVYVFFKFAQKNLIGNYDFILFTNYKNTEIIVDNINIIHELKKMNVKIIIRDFTYKLPKNYYGSWGNQLYEFDILNEFYKLYSPDSKLLMLDSDCLIMQDLSDLFKMLDNSPAITFWGEDYYNCKDDLIIDGITERDMTNLTNEYLGTDYKRIHYMNGEFFCARYDFIEHIVNEFPEIYNFMVNKFYNNPVPECVKFNEEAHFLSYFYAKYDITTYIREEWIKRMWTADNYYRIVNGDENIPIWHVLCGKKRYNLFIKKIDKILSKSDRKIIMIMKSILFSMNCKFEEKLLRQEHPLRYIKRKILKFHFLIQ